MNFRLCPSSCGRRSGGSRIHTLHPEATYDSDDHPRLCREALQNSPDYLAKQERLGRERMLIYKTMVLTGLRRGEVASITVGRLHLDAPQPHAELLAKDAKAGSAALIPLRADLVGDLRDWLDEKLEALRAEAEEKGAPPPLNLPAHEPLFSVPRNLIMSFNLDSPYGERRPTSPKRTRLATPSTCMPCATLSAPGRLRGRPPQQQRRRAPHRPGRHPAFVAQGYFGGVGCATPPSTSP